MNKNQELFEKAPVSKAVAVMAIPTMISMLVVVIYNMADTFFVGLTNKKGICHVVDDHNQHRDHGRDRHHRYCFGYRCFLKKFLIPIHVTPNPPMYLPVQLHQTGLSFPLPLQHGSPPHEPDPYLADFL